MVLHAKYVIALVSGLCAFQVESAVPQRLYKPELPTPTMAFLTHSVLKNKVRTKFKKEISRYKDQLVLPILQREQLYATTHTPFYHAQQVHYLVLYDLYERIYEKVTKKPVQEFTFMRLWNHKGLAGDVNDFNDYYDGKRNGYFDSDRTIARDILSVNYSLFGNITHGMGECSFSYFVGGTNIHAFTITELARPLFDYYQLDTFYLKAFEELAASLPQQPGIICQILIPHAYVDTCVYVSQPCGIPWNEGIADVAGFDARKKRFTHITPLLETYRQNPALIADLDGKFFQARILFTPEMVNPGSGVKIFRYHTLPDEVYKKYRTEFDHLVHDLFEKWQAPAAL